MSPGRESPEAHRQWAGLQAYNAHKELVEQLFKLRFQRATGRIENPMKIREVKREIARIKTLLGERSRA